MLGKMPWTYFESKERYHGPISIVWKDTMDLLLEYGKMDILLEYGKIPWTLLLEHGKIL